MNIYDLKLEPIERIQTSSSEEAARLMASARYPLIISGLKDDFEFLHGWDLDFFSRMNTKVPVQKPEADGVNYFIRYTPMQMSEVVANIRNGEDIYIGARKFMGPKAQRVDHDGIGELSEKILLPKSIDRERIYSANLWIGAGNNNTLLHYDAWDSVLMLGMGKKEFVVFPDTESSRMFQYSAFNFKALAEGRVLHSKIRPLNVQTQYRKVFSQAKGLRGTVNAGDIVFVPAGFWHFVESTGTNIAINFFIHTTHHQAHFHEPLRTYWIKDNITLWPVRWYWKLKANVARTYRYFFPKPVNN